MKHSITKRSVFMTGLSSIFFCSIVNAQIVYTDIPDVTLDCRIYGKNSYCSKSYSLDLNNDGTADFTVNAETYSYPYERSVCYYKCSEYHNKVFVSPLNENAAYADTLNYSSWPLPFRPGDEIGASLIWSTNTPGTLHDTVHYCWYLYNCTDWSFALGKWITENDRYLGVRLIVKNQTYYGWIRLSIAVTPKQAKCMIKDYAFMNTPDKAILAGDTGAPLANSSVSNASKKDAASLNLKIVPNPLSSTAIFSFSLPVAGKVSIRLYDKTGTLVMNVTDREFSEGSHQIQLDARGLEAGTYFLRLESEGILQTRKFIVIK